MTTMYYYTILYLSGFTRNFADYPVISPERGHTGPDRLFK